MRTRLPLLSLVWPALLGAALLAGSADALAQREPRRPFERGASPRQERMNPEERQRLREDVDSARGDYRSERMRREESRPRMSPEERERLRRDVFDANRELRRR